MNDICIYKKINHSPHLVGRLWLAGPTLESPGIEDMGTLRKTVFGKHSWFANECILFKTGSQLFGGCI